MANGAKAICLYEWKRLQQIDSTDVVLDGLHAAALVAEGFEVWMVVRQQRVWRGQHDVTALGEFDAVFVIGAVSETHDDFLSEGVGLMQRQDGRRFYVIRQRLFRNEQISRHTRSRLGSITQPATKIR